MLHLNLIDSSICVINRQSILNPHYLITHFTHLIIIKRGVQERIILSKVINWHFAKGDWGLEIGDWRLENLSFQLQNAENTEISPLFFLRDLCILCD
jgi:hypothetical protein